MGLTVTLTNSSAGWREGAGGGVPLKFLGGGVPPGSPNPDPIIDQKNVIRHTCFQTSSLRNYVIVTYIRTPTKKIS